MRLTSEQIANLKQVVMQSAGPGARVRLFGSRLDDSARGGDVDLLLELPTPTNEPAVLAATLSTHASRVLDGRKVDVLLTAPNLKRLPIHDHALAHGVVL